MQSTGMQGHFQVLAADDRFDGLQIGLYRQANGSVPSYEIVVAVEDQDLNVVRELADFATERDLQSRIDGTGDVVLYELT